MSDFPFNIGLQELIFTILWVVALAYSIWNRKWKSLGLFCLGLAVVLIPMKLGWTGLAIVGFPIASVSWLFAVFMAFDD
jgi:hypothetical protein